MRLLDIFSDTHKEKLQEKIADIYHTHHTMLGHTEILQESKRCQSN